jgi:hypothetical protein
VHALTTTPASRSDIEQRSGFGRAGVFRWAPGKLLHQFGGLIQVSPCRHLCSEALADPVEFVEGFLAELKGVGIRTCELLGLGLGK